jgi:hypothetical protein
MTMEPEASQNTANIEVDVHYIHRSKIYNRSVYDPDYIGRLIGKIIERPRIQNFCF